MAAARLTKNNSSRKESKAVLLVTDQYATSKEEDVSTMNRQVVQILTGAGRKVYSLVLEDTEEDRKCAEADGVELIFPSRRQGDTRTPSLDWLTFDHRARYPSLPQDVGWIVGHAGVTSSAAAAIKEQSFPQANISLVIKTIPENTEKYKEEEKAMGIGRKEDSIREDAGKADTVFSVGHQIHDHFTNTFLAIPKDKRPIHYLFLPEPADLFQKTTVEYRETKEKIVLLVSRVNEVEKQKGLDFAAKAVARVAERSHERIQLRICGVSEEEYQASMNILQASINSGNLIPTLLPHGTQEDICRDMQQAHLVLMPSRTEPFGLIGLEAMAAGVPVLISDQSGLATLVKKVIPEFHHSAVGITGDDTVDVRHWADQIEKVLQMSEAEFSRAAALKQRLLESKYWKESHQRFLQAFGGDDDTQQTVQAQKRKRSAESVRDEDLEKDRKVVKLDQKVKLSVKTLENTTLEGKKILQDKLKEIFTKGQHVSSSVIFKERMEMYEQSKAEVMDDTVSEKGKDILLHIINESFKGDVLNNKDRFKETMNNVKILKAEILEVSEGCVLCKLRFDHRQNQVEFVTACRDGSLSAILTEEYISHELVEICGGMPLYVHVEVDEADFQRGADLDGQSQSMSSVDQTAALTAEIQQMELQDQPTTKPSPEPTDSDDQQTTEAPDDTDVPPDISDLVSLDIRELEQLMGQPRKRTFSVGSKSSDSGFKSRTPRSGPSRPDSLTGVPAETQGELETLLAEMNTPAVMEDKAQQFDLYCQIGDLYRTKLHNLQSALQYYQNMLECSQALSEDTKQAKAYSRLGLTCDILGLQQEAFRNHERALAIYRVETKNETDICVAYKNLASSLALSGQVSDAKTNYESALAVAMETGNKTEQMDIYCKLGDLHLRQLQEPQISHGYYTVMLEITKDLRRKDRERQAYNRLGLACGDMQDNEAALEWHQKYLKMSQDDGDKKEQITAHCNVGDTYRRLGKLEQATSHFNTALQMAQQTGDQRGQMKVYFSMGEMHREQLHTPHTAIQYYEQHLALARQLMDRHEEGVAYNKLGLVHYEMGEYETALGWHQKHLKMRQDDGDRKEQITAHTNVGNTYRLLGKLDLATSHFNTALQMAQQTGDQHGQMKVYLWMGDMHREQLHSPHTAIQYYEQHLALARQLMDRHEEGVAYNRLGQAHDEMGDNEAALEWHQKYLKMSQDDGDKKAQITAHRNVGNAYRRLGKLDQATSHFNTALQMAQHTGDQHGQMTVYYEMGDMHREQLHSPHTAIQYYEQYLALARQLMDRHEEGVAYNRLGLAHDEMGEYETGLEWYQKNLRLRQESGDKKAQITAHKNIADSYEALGKLDLARSHYQSAMPIAMETGNKQEQEDIAKRLAELQ
ncbi:uncharacterized protein [Branchiostoma lanceolatum]|uniref:uncharacterized protein n=1 Tax=Branchiostoma lanceolatum TaxID=7740 RepID=UPI0034515D23